MLLRSCKWLEAKLCPNPDVVAELRTMGFGHGAIGAVIVRGLVYYIVRGRSMHSDRRVAPETVEGLEDSAIIYRSLSGRSAVLFL